MEESGPSLVEAPPKGRKVDGRSRGGGVPFSKEKKKELKILRCSINYDRKADSFEARGKKSVQLSCWLGT